MLPSEIHQKNILEGKCIDDPEQLLALKALDGFQQQLIDGCLQDSGLYLWGKVGRGKTYLMDCLGQSLPESLILRQHYYRFMQFVHQQLAVHQGMADPLILVAKDLAARCEVLCLDEFFVSDIGDAMLLSRLLEALFDQNISLVTTSNVVPDQLYRDGLQRDRFVPAIKMLQQKLRIISFSGEVDHRLAKACGFPHFMVGEDNRQLLQQRFEQLSDDIKIATDTVIVVQGREIECLAAVDGAYLFSFTALFEGPRSVHDYIELAERARFICVCDIIQMGGKLSERKVARGTEDTFNINQRVADRPFVAAKNDDAARRFISFVDELYDRRIPLILGAQVPLAELYLGGRVAFEFERVRSRIIEMQSLEYSGI